LYGLVRDEYGLITWQPESWLQTADPAGREEFK